MFHVSRKRAKKSNADDEEHRKLETNYPFQSEGLSLLLFNFDKLHAQVGSSLRIYHDATPFGVYGMYGW